MALVRGEVRQQGHRARPLDRVRDLTLMSRAAPGDPARDDLAALAHEASQPANVLVIDQVDLVDAELTDLAPAEPAAFNGLLG